MIVIAINRADFQVRQYNNVTSITITDSTITVVHAGGTYALGRADWIVQFVND